MGTSKTIPHAPTPSAPRGAFFLAPLLLLLLVLAASCSSAETEDESSSISTSDTETSAASDSDAGTSADATTSAAEPPLHPNSLAAIYRQHAKEYSGSDRRTAAVRRIEGQRAMDTAVVLAKYSSSDDHEAARREQAAQELRTRFESRNLKDAEALDLLDTVAPEASINARREAARKLAELSEIEDWDGRNALDAAEEINRLITGDHLHAEKRIAAAKELTRRSKAGDLDTDTALKLMNDVAPGLSINARREAAGNLVRLSRTERWDAETSKQAAEETFKLVTGGGLDVEMNADGTGVTKLKSRDNERVNLRNHVLEATYR